MALIECSECGTEVSSNAAACPKCGNPIVDSAEAKAAGTNVVTNQETAKKFKLQAVLSMVCVIAGALWIILGGDNSTNTGEPEGPNMAAGSMVALGFLWYGVNRVRIWWHHK